MEHFVKATTINPKFPNAHFNAAISSAKAGDHDKAVQWYKQALDLTPKNAMYYHHYGASLMEGKEGLERASEAFGHSVRLKGDDAESYNLLGVVQVCLFLCTHRGCLTILFVCV